MTYEVHLRNNYPFELLATHCHIDVLGIDISLQEFKSLLSL